MFNFFEHPLGTDAQGETVGSSADTTRQLPILDDNGNPTGSVTLVAVGTTCGKGDLILTHTLSGAKAKVEVGVVEVKLVVEEKVWGPNWLNPTAGWAIPEDRDVASDPDPPLWYVLWTTDQHKYKVTVNPTDVVSGVTINGPAGSVTNPSAGVWEKIITSPSVARHSDLKAIVSFTGGGSIASDPVDVSIHAIQSIQWLSRSASGTRGAGTPAEAHLAKLEAHGGAYRTFPEKTEPSPTSPNYDKAEARVTITPAIPTDMEGTVHVALFDPNNPIGSTEIPTTDGHGVRDNHGSMSVSDGNNVVTLNAGETIKSKGFAISPAHAGDNYIVAVHPKAGIASQYVFVDEQHHNTSNYYGTIGQTLLCQYPSFTFGDFAELPAALQTKTLTVWRTLNVERDVCVWPGRPNNNNGELLAPLDGFVATELALACVVTQEFTPNPNPGPTIKAEVNDAEERTAVQTGRDISGNCHEFWTVRILTASKNGTDYGGFSPGANGISITYAGIKGLVDAWNVANPNDTADLTTIIRRTVLHEIGHLLMDGVHPSDGVMRTGIGVGDRKNTQYQRFLKDDLKKIQLHSRARD